MATDRVLPHNLDAERAILGAIIIDNTRAHVTAQHLRPEMFFRDAHRRIYTALVTLSEASAQIDLVTLNAELARAGDLEDVGGPAYIASLIDGVPRSSNIEHYVSLVKDRWLLRQVIHASQKITARAYEADEAGEGVATWAEQALMDVRGGTVSPRLQALDTVAAGALFRDIEHRVAHRGELSGVTTGFSSLNGLTQGWQRGDLIIVAARPSIGKTTFALNSAVAAAQAGAKVAIFSLEMRRQQLEYRILSGLSSVPLMRLQAGWIGDSDYVPLSLGLEQMAATGIYIDDTAGLTVQQIRASCRYVQAHGGLDLVVIDYVQLMPGSLDRRGSTRNEEITDISRRLKVLADELHAPVILVSQLNRGAASRDDPRPKLSDLRESGALEQDADIVIFLHRRHHKEGGSTELIVEKARNGPTGTVYINLDRDLTLFTQGEAPLTEPGKPQARPSAADMFEGPA